MLYPLPARNEGYGYGVAIAYLEPSGEHVETRPRPSVVARTWG
ncbi:hypothetical protein ACFYYR_14930 [Streptomyces sp. NPDC001922]